MVGRETSGAVKKQRRNHLLRTFLTLGAILLVFVTISLASEIYLQAFTVAPGEFTVDLGSVRATFSLAFASLQVALPVIGALVAAPLLLARLLQNLHGMRTISEAHDRLNQLLFGSLGTKHRVLVKEGKVASTSHDVIKSAGGPASLTVYDDSAVVTEQGGSLKRVLGTGVHTLDRYERIWETVDLRPQRWVRQVFALTKEGIPISCDLDTLFRLDISPENKARVGQPKAGEAETTAPCDEEALLRAATSRCIRKEDQQRDTMSWAERVAALAESTLRDILATYRLDWLIKAPQSGQPHPRDEIHQRLRAELEGRLDQLSAKLLSVDLGQIRVEAQDIDGSEEREMSDTLSAIISDQWIDAWHANWKAQALTSRAEGEAELLRLETARIEAQAEMIIRLTEILQPIVASRPTSEPYVLALRLVEALRWMSYDPSTRDYMPPEAMRTLRRLQQLLDSDDVIPSERTAAEGESEET